MILTSDVKSIIKKHAREESPRECCGFIIEGDIVYKAKNSSIDGNKFSISPKDYISADMLGDIVAVYHSHPSDKEASFSDYDKFNSITHNFIYVLYSLKDNSFTQFDPSLSDYNKYIGREFEIGKTDCFALIKDFYEAELNIIMRNYKRDENWKSYLSELFDKNFKNEGFSEVKDLRKYDCILMRTRGHGDSAHIAIYLGNNLILHQPERGYSRIEEYTDRHKKLTNKIIRHYGVN